MVKNVEDIFSGKALPLSVMFTARCYAQARTMPSRGVRLSIYPSVRPSVRHVRVFCPFSVVFPHKTIS